MRYRALENTDVRFIDKNEEGGPEAEKRK